MKRVAVALSLLLAGCAAGPNYTKPSIEAPNAWKEAGAWVVAQPKDAIPKGRWWEIFADAQLNELEEQVEVSNQTLKQSEARYRQARAATQLARSSLFPSLTAGASATRSRALGNRVDAELDAHWEVDLWGRLRRGLEAARAGEEASAADLAAARLSIQGDLAINYFQLRVTDELIDLLEDSVKAFEASYKVTLNRYEGGVASKSDVVQAEAQLRSTQAQAIDTRVTRAQFENAVAVLAGKQPSTFHIEAKPFRLRIPDIPPGIPSTMIERRPDVASAERNMAAANARIGVAEAAWFPSLTLTGSGGYAGSSFAHLFSAPNRFWSIGAALSETLLDFGARSANIDSARASFDLTQATYRQTVLAAFQEVENNLAAIHWLGEESKVQQEAARAARQSVELTVNQYKAGTVSYLNVVQVQTTQLSEERTTVSLLGRRLAATVGLIRAIGGGI